MFGWLRGKPPAERGREAARRFLASRPTLAEIREQWGSSRFLNDEYDRAWQAEVRPHMYGQTDEA